MSLCWFYVDDPRQQPSQQTVCAPGPLAVDIPPAAAVAGVPRGKVIDVIRHPPSLDTQLLSTISSSPFLLSNMDMKLNWQYVPTLADTTSSKPDTSKHFHIFVGDLCPYLQPYQLKEAFSVYGQISDCKIIQDPQTMRSKGYGFVTFVKKDDAAKAINAMNGQQLGSRVIRTNWAMRKLSLTGTTGKLASYDEVFGQSSSGNTTVYCGGIMTGLTEEMIRKAFTSFGTIEEIRVFEEKGYAFIRFDSKEAATAAIIGTHLTQINGHVVKCSWGKKGEDPQQITAVTSSTSHKSSTTSPPSSVISASLSPCNLQQPHQLGLQGLPAVALPVPPLGLNIALPNHQHTHSYDRPVQLSYVANNAPTSQTALASQLQGYYVIDQDSLKQSNHNDCSTLLPNAYQQPTTYGLCDYRTIQVPTAMTSQLPAMMTSQALPQQRGSANPGPLQSLGLVGLYTLQPVE